MSKTVRRIITTAIIIIAIIALTIIMVINTSSKTRKNAIDHMKAITAQQASMIESFIENAENTLMGFGQSPEVKLLLQVVRNNDDIANAENRSLQPRLLRRLRSILRSSPRLLRVSRVCG